MKYFVLYYVI